MRKASIMEFEYCPDHGSSVDRLRAYACPDDCTHFIAMIEKQIEEVKAGHFFRRYRDDEGLTWSQEYRDHEPHGEPRTTGFRS